MRIRLLSSYDRVAHVGSKYNVKHLSFPMLSLTFPHWVMVNSKTSKAMSWLSRSRKRAQETLFRAQGCWVCSTPSPQHPAASVPPPVGNAGSALCSWPCARAQNSSEGEDWLTPCLMFTSSRHPTSLPSRKTGTLIHSHSIFQVAKKWFWDKTYQRQTIESFWMEIFKQL